MQYKKHLKRYDLVTSFRADPDIKAKLKKVNHGQRVAFINEAIRRAPLPEKKKSRDGESRDGEGGDGD